MEQHGGEAIATVDDAYLMPIGKCTLHKNFQLKFEFWFQIWKFYTYDLIFMSFISMQKILFQQYLFHMKFKQEKSFVIDHINCLSMRQILKY